MQSKKNNEKEQEETRGEEQVTLSLEEYSEMKKRLHELGGMDPSMQSLKGEESPGLVPETPHIQTQYKQVDGYIRVSSCLKEVKFSMTRIEKIVDAWKAPQSKIFQVLPRTLT